MAKGPKNTPEQLAAIKAADEAWAEEQTWPMWEVELEGDEVEWAARPGINEDENGVPQPFTKAAYCSVKTRAPTKDKAVARSMEANPGYHTVLSAKQIER